MRERKLRSEAESLARLKASAYLVPYIIQDQRRKLAQKHNTNMLSDRSKTKTTVESNVLIA